MSPNPCKKVKIEKEANNVLSCDICNRKYKTRRSLEKHREAHAFKELECSICRSLFTDQQKRERHELLHADEKYKCDQCGQLFSQSYNLMIHKRIHTGDRPHECHICSKRFTQITHLNTHLKMQHGVLDPIYSFDPETAFEDAAKVPENYSGETEEKFPCEICDKSFGRLSFKNRHMKNHVNESIVCECDICGRGFVNLSRLMKHRPRHKNDPRCGVCFRVFPALSLLQRHMFTHTKERPHQCTICAKNYAQEYDLKIHIRCHKNIRPYACDQCDQAFTRSSHLKTHRKLKHGILVCKKFKCNKCQKEFNDMAYLNIHKKVHLIKKLKCQVCKKMFSKKSTLLMHERVHTIKKSTRVELSNTDKRQNSNTLKLENKTKLGKKELIWNKALNDIAQMESDNITYTQGSHSKNSKPDINDAEKMLDYHDRFLMEEKNAFPDENSNYDIPSYETTNIDEDPHTPDPMADSNPVVSHDMPMQYNRLYVCVLCGGASRKKQKIYKHITTHSNLPDQPVKIVMSCNLCKKYFSAHEFLIKHYGTYHPELLASDVVSASLQHTRFTVKCEQGDIHIQNSTNVSLPPV